MKILLTGATGFVGRHFQDRAPSMPLADPEGNWIDIMEEEALREAVRRLQPEGVVHLAGESFVPESFTDPGQTLRVNVLGTLNLLQALDNAGFKGRMIHVGSGEVYGLVTGAELPLGEDHPLRPRNPYAASKAGAEALAYQWSQTGNFEIVLTRPFNHTGPGQSERFVLSQFARQIVAIRAGRQEKRLVVGDIDVTRDFTDVRDVVDAYRLLLEHGKNGEIYNICSGVEHTIRELADKLQELAAIKVPYEQDSERLRPTEQRRVVGDNRKLKAHTGWAQHIPMEQTLQDMLDYWEKEAS